MAALWFRRPTPESIFERHKGTLPGMMGMGGMPGMPPMGMGGVVAITEHELMAWQVNQAIRLAPWECRLVRRMSKEYAAMAGAATKPDCPMPWVPVGDDVRARVADQIKSVFAGLRRAG